MRSVIDLMYRYPVTSAFILGCASVVLFVAVFSLQDLEEGRESDEPEETPAVEAKAEVKHGRRAARRA